MTDETHRFFRIIDQTAYAGLCQHVDATRGYPDGNGTERGLPPWDRLFVDPEIPTTRLYCLDRWRFGDSDEGPLQSAINADAVIELDLETFLARLHWEPPVEEDLEAIDELELTD